MQVSRSYDDRTARISLQISINVKKQQDKKSPIKRYNRGAPSGHPVPECLRIVQGRNPVFPAPSAFPPSVKRCLGLRDEGRNRKNAPLRHKSDIMLMLRCFFKQICDLPRQSFEAFLRSTPTRTSESRLTLPETALRNAKGATQWAAPSHINRRKISASRTGSCGGPWLCHISYARPRGCRGSGSLRPSGPRAGRAGAAAEPG
ncbi:hypothetical protein PANO111632_20385 [Paracoccus nototheniae]